MSSKSDSLLVKDQEEAENLAEALPGVVEKYEALFADWFVDADIDVQEGLRIWAGPDTISP